MLLCGPSDVLRLPACFPRGGCPLFGGLVGHLRQRSEYLVEIFLRDDPECFATADEHFFQTVRPAPGVPFKQDAALLSFL